MQHNQSSDNMTVEAMADALARRSIVMRRSPKSALFKEALDKEAANPLQWIGKQWGQLDNPSRSALLGAGIGGIGGGLLNWMSTDKDDEKRHPFQSALTGSLAGAGIGGGLSFARSMWDNKNQAEAADRARQVRRNIVHELRNANKEGPGWYGSRFDPRLFGLSLPAGVLTTIAGTTPARAAKRYLDNLGGKIQDTRLADAIKAMNEPRPAAKLKPGDNLTLREALHKVRPEQALKQKKPAEGGPNPPKVPQTKNLAADIQAKPVLQQALRGHVIRGSRLYPNRWFKKPNPTDRAIHNLVRDADKVIKPRHPKLRAGLGGAIAASPLVAPFAQEALAKALGLVFSSDQLLRTPFMDKSHIDADAAALRDRQLLHNIQSIR